MKDILIVGGSPDGYVWAIRAAQLGDEVIVVERAKHSKLSVKKFAAAEDLTGR